MRFSQKAGLPSCFTHLPGWSSGSVRLQRGMLFTFRDQRCEAIPWERGLFFRRELLHTAIAHGGYASLRPRRE